MSYEVGTYIDLRHVNKKHEATAKPAQKKSFPPDSVRRLYAVGTQFIFDQTTGKLAIKIPVALA